MTALIVLAAILAVSLAALFIPIKCEAYLSYANDSLDESFDLKYGFIRIRLPNGGKKDKEWGDDKGGSGKKENRLGGAVAFARENFREVKEAIYNILGCALKRSVTIKNLDLKIVFGLEDAMATGLLYGALAAFVYNVIGAANRLMKLKSHSEDIRPDFKDPHIFAELECIITTNIFNLAVLAVVFLKNAAPLYKKYERRNDNGKSDKGAD